MIVYFLSQTIRLLFVFLFNKKIIYIYLIKHSPISSCVQGRLKELKQHEMEHSAYHLQLVGHAVQQLNAKSTKLVSSESSGGGSGAQALERVQLSTQTQSTMDAVMKLESIVQQLQEGYGEMSLIVQTLQATSYDGTFIWKIPEVQRRRHEAMIGKTISLYSAPFYTSRYGYKMCLRLYMDGDGSGKGTHLSFFLTIMRGEYDALLTWPFKQAVTLMLLDQDKQKDIVQSFRPEPTSSSFQRPRNEMNVASGCPLFAPLSVLNNSSYVKDDVLFMKCKIDSTGLEY